MYNINNMKLGTVVMRNRLLLVIITTMAVALATSNVTAQAPTPTPSDLTGNWGGYTVSSSIEFGLRGISFNGSDEKFKSDLNYRPGFRIWDSSFTIKPVN